MPAVSHLILEDLFQVAEVLTNYGFDQKDIYRAARDVEDAQIAAAARSLNGVPVCLVSEDGGFDALNEVPAKTPLEALTWLHGETDAPSAGNIPFIDLAAQQALIRSKLEQGIVQVLNHGQYIQPLADRLHLVFPF